MRVRAATRRCDMRTVGTHWVAAAALLCLLGRHRSTWSQHGHSCRRRCLQGDYGVHGDGTASLPHPYGMTTARVLRLERSVLILLCSYRDYTELPRRWAMSYVQIVNASELKECVEENCIGVPAADRLPNDDQPTPYFILGDEVCAQRQITKEQNIFNHRLPSITDCLRNPGPALADPPHYDATRPWDNRYYCGGLRNLSAIPRC